MTRLVSILVISLTLASIIFSTQPAEGGIVTICERSDTVNITPISNLYVVQNNIWNDLDNSQCLHVNNTNGNFSITSANHNKLNGAPAAYPSTFKGCHWGNCSNNSGMPIKLTSILHAMSGWSTVQPTLGVYNVAYDIWFNRTPTTPGQPNGAELMIWLHHQGSIQPSGARIAQAVSIDGANWDVWLGSNNGINVISYVRTVSVTSVSLLNLKTFFTDAKIRGYLQPTWYLLDIEAGFEVWQHGAGLASSGFWALVE